MTRGRLRWWQARVFAPGVAIAAYEADTPIVLVAASANWVWRLRSWEVARAG